jgi:hypothetical protein
MMTGTQTPSTPSDGAERGLRRFLRRVSISQAELDAADLLEGSARTGATASNQCRRGMRVTVAGRITSVVYTPRTHVPTLEAELFDGAGPLTLVWLGQRRIAGIEPGRRLSAQGRVALRGDQRVIFNPRYTLEASS